MGASVLRLPDASQAPIRPPRWSFKVAETTGDRAVLATIPFDDVSFNLPLNDSGSFQASVTLDQRITAQLDMQDLTEPDRRSFYAFRDDVPIYGGIIWTSNYQSSTQKLSIGGSDWWSYFDRRKIVSTSVDNLPNDPEWIARLAFTLNNVDQNSAVRAVLSLAQGHPGGHIGLLYDLSMSGITVDKQWRGFDLKDTGAAVKEMSQALDGPDVRFVVTNDSTQPGNVGRKVLIGDPSLGQVGSPHVFEYGRNLYDYNWPRDGASMRTRAYAIGEGTAEGMNIAFYEDSGLYAAGYPLLEEEVSYSTVRDFAELQGNAESDQIAARTPITLPTLQLRPGVGPHLGEFNPGDDVRLRIKDPYWGFDPGFDGQVRINDIQVSWSSSGGEQVTLVCAPLLGV